MDGLISLILALPFIGVLVVPNSSQDKISQTAHMICTTPASLNILIDKQSPLPSDFVPPDLVYLSEKGVSNSGGLMLREEAAEKLWEVSKALHQKNFAVTVFSAYRNSDSQHLVYEQSIGQMGNVLGARTAAVPGESEHQLGTAIDIKLPSGEPIYPSTAWEWLDKNAHKFGFVMSYRYPHQELTGFRFEPWHWRYVGVDLATKTRYSPDPPQTHYQKIGCH